MKKPASRSRDTGKRADASPARSKQECELHLCEGFSGEVIIIALNRELIERVEVRTRLQVGMAKVIHLKYAPGDTLLLQVEGAGTAAQLEMKDNDRWLRADLISGALTIERISAMPMYA
ncbi:MAG: hypothetical protein IPJ85_00900 [Flavobacteriales bacterium]|nr:hypothetical protein [Flavobacteriales bacterium]